MTSGSGPRTPADGVNLPGYLRALWQLDDDTSRPGPKRAIEMASIGRVGVELADAEGLAAISMRRVAADLGFSTMALYRYVQSKEELIQVVLDTAFGPVTLVFGEGQDWRDRIRSWAHAYRDLLIAHPWILDVRMVEPPLTPHQIEWMELGAQALTGTGLGHQEMLSSLLTVDLFVRGQRMLASQLGGSEPGEVDAGVVWGTRLAALIDPERFPAVSAAIGSGALDDDSDFDEEELSFGLETVLDGIEARLRRAQSARAVSRRRPRASN